MLKQLLARVQATEALVASLARQHHHEHYHATALETAQSI
jgi:hypothetical protein